MKDTIIALREKWNALQLKLLVPARLADEDFGAVLAAREDSLTIGFRERLPLIVASFKESAQEEIMRRARTQQCTVRSTPEQGDYCSDINAMNRVLFRASAHSEPDIQIGHFTRPRKPRLHRDEYQGYDRATQMDIRNSDLMYTARIGGLAAHYVRGKDEMNATPEVQALIVQAQENDTPESARAIQTLCEQRILVPLSLGSVALLLACPDNEASANGTLHCSCPVPPEGAYSAFFRLGANSR